MRPSPNQPGHPSLPPRTLVCRSPAACARRAARQPRTGSPPGCSRCSAWRSPRRDGTGCPGRSERPSALKATDPPLTPRTADRIPVSGRLFEALGEDPWLSGQMAVRYVQGIQCHPVVATAKHYNVNTQEENRFEADAQLDERTLQEIYTPAFEAAVKDGQVGSVMGAFNKT